MKKCLGILAVLLIVCGAASAATTTNTLNSGSQFGVNVFYELQPSRTWSYVQTGIAPADGTWDTEVISSATLTITYKDFTVPNDVMTITADSTNLGTLPMLFDSFTTGSKTFPLASSSILDKTLNVSVSTTNSGIAGYVLSSTVTVTYDAAPTPPPPAPAVPAPGVVALSAMGLGLVNWLRSRKAL